MVHEMLCPRAAAIFITKGFSPVYAVLEMGRRFKALMLHMRFDGIYNFTISNGHKTIDTTLQNTINTRQSAQNSIYLVPSLFALCNIVRKHSQGSIVQSPDSLTHSAGSKVLHLEKRFSPALYETGNQRIDERSIRQRFNPHYKTLPKHSQTRIGRQFRVKTGNLFTIFGVQGKKDSAIPQ